MRGKHQGEGKPRPYYTRPRQPMRVEEGRSLMNITKQDRYGPVILSEAKDLTRPTEILSEAKDDSVWIMVIITWFPIVVTWG